MAKITGGAFTVSLGYSVSVLRNPSLTQDDFNEVMEALAEWTDEPNQKNLDGMLSDYTNHSLDDELAERAKGLRIACEIVHRETHHQH